MNKSLKALIGMVLLVTVGYGLSKIHSSPVCLCGADDRDPVFACGFNYLADAIFTGTVKELREDTAERQYVHTVVVKEVFRGAVEGTTVEVVIPKSSCSFRMYPGEEFLIHSERELEPGKYSVSGICTGTSLADRSNKLLKKLREQKKEGTIDSSEFVLSVYEEGKLVEGKPPYVSQISLRSEQDSRVHIFDLDKHGYAVTRNLPAGKYKIVPLLPSGYEYEVSGEFRARAEDDSEDLIEIRGRGCAGTFVKIKQKKDAER